MAIRQPTPHHPFRAWLQLDDHVLHVHARTFCQQVSFGGPSSDRQPSAFQLRAPPGPACWRRAQREPQAPTEDGRCEHRAAPEHVFCSLPPSTLAARVVHELQRHHQRRSSLCCWPPPLAPPQAGEMAHQRIGRQHAPGHPRRRRRSAARPVFPRAEAAADKDVAGTSSSAGASRWALQQQGPLKLQRRCPHRRRCPRGTAPSRCHPHADGSFQQPRHHRVREQQPRAHVPVQHLHAVDAVSAWGSPAPSPRIPHQQRL